MTRRRLITGEESSEDLTQRISQLQSQMDALDSQGGASIGTIEAPEAGYFISTVDGLENAVDIEEVEHLTVPQVEGLLEKPVENQDSVGKICSDFNWYVACIFDKNEIVHFEDVTQVYLDIPFASTEQIPAEVVAKNRDEESGNTVVIFRCSYMDSDIAAVRNEAIQVTVPLILVCWSMNRPSILRMWNTPPPMKTGTPSQRYRRMSKECMCSMGESSSLSRCFPNTP